MRYGAFLSYSHADERHARWLLRRLEGYRVPSRLVGRPGKYGEVPARLGRVFRDRDELPSAGDLGETITAALDDSAALVVICSPAAAKSRWVNAEITAFRALGRADRIFCFIVGGDPQSQDECARAFPPAILEPDCPEGPSREPLAADARREGDGPERALTKLLAGLLGVGYDDLAQREAQQRNRRLALIAGVSLAGMALALVLAGAAYMARNDAQRRQAQAEDILGFMLGDLRKKLTTVGRLDLMRAVDDKAQAYFATLDPRDLSDRALEEQARALTGMGQVRLDEGDHDAALAAFTEAHSRATALHQREPEIGQRLFDLAQAEYWIGYVALQQGREDEAATWFTRYRDRAIELARKDSNNFEWQKEVAYGHHNLAVLDESMGRYAEAESSMRAELALYEVWLQQRPADLELRFEAANVASWLGSLSLRQGRLEQAEGFFLQQTEAMRRSMEEDPKNARWQEIYVDALLLLADARLQRGNLRLADEAARDAATIGGALVARDPDNNYWRLSFGRCRYTQALIDSISLPTSSAIQAEDAARLLAAAHTAEPKNERILTWLARTRQLQAQLALGRGDVATARAQLEASIKLIEPVWQAAPNEALRIWRARADLLQGVVAARDDDREGAQNAWSSASELLLDSVQGEVPFPRLDPLVRALMYLGEDSRAQPHMQRLATAGYVPLHPFPAGAQVGWMASKAD